MHPRTLSLILPTRCRVAALRRLLDSLAETTARPDELEIVLVVDADDAESIAFRHALPVRHAVVPPGLTMGALNMAGYEASRGELVMLLNDDVIVRTPGWDERVRACFCGLPDGIALVHVNDTLMREHLCTFPIVSRIFCDLAGGICPVEYVRYRIDDHIEDVFNLLATLGERRTFYLPDVIFEHLNGVVMPQGHSEYHADPHTLALDAPRFDALFGRRKELALALLEHIERAREQVRSAMRRRWLAGITDPFSLRSDGRQRSAAAPRVSVVALAETPGAMNRLAAAAEGDYVAFLPSGAAAEALTCHLAADVALVTAGAAVLIDRLRCPPFEESYERHFFVEDLALRVRKAGLRVVELPAAKPLPECEATYERDWQTFARAWMTTGSDELFAERGRTLAALRRRRRNLMHLTRRAAGQVADVGRRGWACLRARGFAGLVRALRRRILPHGWIS